jgi:hypothetical protein
MAGPGPTIDDARQVIASLDSFEKRGIARELLRSFDPGIRTEVLDEFSSFQEEPEYLQYRHQRNVLLSAVCVIILCLGVLVFVSYTAPDQLERVIGLLTSLATGALGYFAGSRRGAQNGDG